MKNLEIENYSIRLQNMEQDNTTLLTEVASLKQQMERIRQERDEIGEELTRAQALLLKEQEQHMMLQENKAKEEEERKREKIANSHTVQEKSEEVRQLKEAIAEHE